MLRWQLIRYLIRNNIKDRERHGNKYAETIIEWGVDNASGTYAGQCIYAEEELKWAFDGRDYVLFADGYVKATFRIK